MTSATRALLINSQTCVTNAELPCITRAFQTGSATPARFGRRTSLCTAPLSQTTAALRTAEKSPVPAGRDWKGRVITLGEGCLSRNPRLLCWERTPARSPRPAGRADLQSYGVGPQTSPEQPRRPSRLCEPGPHLLQSLSSLPSTQSSQPSQRIVRSMQRPVLQVNLPGQAERGGRGKATREPFSRPPLCPLSKAHDVPCACVQHPALKPLPRPRTRRVAGNHPTGKARCRWPPDLPPHPQGFNSRSLES